jgi:inner membrane protein
MDILTHSLSGLAIGTVVSSFSNQGATEKLKIILLSGFAGALPDLDAISLWSRFDSTIGEFFNLTHSGKVIYSAKFWYSHHGFLHSVLGALLIAVLIGFINFLINSGFRNLSYKNFIHSVSKNRLLLIGFVLGFTLHLLEDMPTPAATWGGVNFFWPSKKYIGGTGDIWWWNNYDIFLIVVSVIIINLILAAINLLVHIDLRKFTTGVFIIGFTLALIQIKTREYDFSYTAHTNRYQEFEHKSKEVQKNILGDQLFHLIENFDNRLGIYF